MISKYVLENKGGLRLNWGNGLKMAHILFLLRLPLAVLSFTLPLMLPSFIMAFFEPESGMAAVFGILIAALALVSVPIFLSFKKSPLNLRARDGFFTVTLTWLFLSLYGALPYYFFGAPFDFTGAFFESASAFTSSGGTTLRDIEILPHSLLFWRSISYWIGGMGIIVLTVALVPLLGAGGFQLVKAESSGPDKEKITPKITGAAKTLWIFYGALTLLAAALYWAGGMSVFDAVCHAFTTVSTGGMSIKNKGLVHYDSAFITIVATVFMFLCAVNFNIYYRLIQRNIKDVFYNSELRAYILLTVTISLVIAFNISGQYDTPFEAGRIAAFQTVAFISTSGTAITDYTMWPPLSQALLVFALFLGGCSGSTAGGIKIIRHIVMFKQACNEMRRLVYPRGIFSVQLNNKIGRKDVVYGVAGFIFVYMMTVLVAGLVTAAAGFDIVTSFTTALAVLGNSGSGFGLLGPENNFSIFPDYLKIFYALVMIAGRLELWTMLILFNREYWRA
jgi:trk system potassium uptake protein TrkH